MLAIKNGIKQYITLALLLLLVQCGSAQKFKLIVIPDTQWSSEKWPELTRKMTSWIVENEKKENIKYVLQVGDLVQVGSNEQEWKNIDTSMKTLDGKVPYILAVGNHDYDRLNGTRSTVLFNKYFPVERFKKMKGFGGSFPEGSNTNSFHIFKAGGKKWLILSMNFAPTEDELSWGNEIVRTHPDFQIIVLTHSYLTHTKRDVTGDLIWEKIASKYPNVSLVFCGHLSTVHFKSEGTFGNTVCEMLFDWQNDREREPNSYFAIITIDSKSGEISVNSYSPDLDKFLQGSRNEFSFSDVHFITSKGTNKTPVKTR